MITCMFIGGALLAVLFSAANAIAGVRPADDSLNRNRFEGWRA